MKKMDLQRRVRPKIAPKMANNEKDSDQTHL